MKPGDLIIRKPVVNITGSLPDDPQLIVEEYFEQSEYNITIPPYRMFKLIGIVGNNGIEKSWSKPVVFIERYFDVISSGSSVP